MEKEVELIENIMKKDILIHDLREQIKELEYENQKINKTMENKIEWVAPVEKVKMNRMKFFKLEELYELINVLAKKKTLFTITTRKDSLPRIEYTIEWKQ